MLHPNSDHMARIDEAGKDHPRGSPGSDLNVPLPHRDEPPPFTTPPKQIMQPYLISKEQRRTIPGVSRRKRTGNIGKVHGCLQRDASL